MLTKKFELVKDVCTCSVEIGFRCLQRNLNLSKMCVPCQCRNRLQVLTKKFELVKDVCTCSVEIGFRCLQRNLNLSKMCVPAV